MRNESIFTCWAPCSSNVFRVNSVVFFSLSISHHIMLRADEQFLSFSHLCQSLNHILIMMRCGEERGIMSNCSTGMALPQGLLCRLDNHAGWGLPGDMAFRSLCNCYDTLIGDPSRYWGSWNGHSPQAVSLYLQRKFGKYCFGCLLISESFHI